MQKNAKAAVLCGADLVLELPVTCALSSAEGFAAGGVRADEIANIAEAEVSVEEGALGHNTSILVTGNDALLAALEEKLAHAVKTVSAGRRRLEVVELPDEPGKKALKAVSDIGLRVIVK